MRPVRNGLLVVLVFCTGLYGHQTQRRAYMKAGSIQHHGTSATVLANDPRPLYQAITTVREEYGWIVHFEDPPFHSDYDFIDDTDPLWRAAHPGAKGARGLAGGSFQADYPEGPDTYGPRANSSGEEERILDKIVLDYNQSGNPGKFAVQQQADGSYAIIGQTVKDDHGNDQFVGSLLDTPISVAYGTRNAFESLSLIIAAISAKTGAKLMLGTLPTNTFVQSEVTIGGDNIPARDLLLQLVSGIKRKLVWNLLCGEDHLCALNLAIASRAHYDTFGNKSLVWLDR